MRLQPSSCCVAVTEVVEEVVVVSGGWWSVVVVIGGEWVQAKLQKPNEWVVAHGYREYS